MTRWDELRDQEERTYSMRRRATESGSAYWNHEAHKDERELHRMEMGDDVDD